MTRIWMIVLFTSVSFRFLSRGRLALVGEVAFQVVFQ